MRKCWRLIAGSKERQVLEACRVGYGRSHAVHQRQRAGQSRCRKAIWTNAGMHVLQSNCAANFHRRIGSCLVKVNCETCPLGAVALQVPLESPSEPNSSVVSSIRMNSTRSPWMRQLFAGSVIENSALPSRRYVRTFSDRSHSCAEMWHARILNTPPAMTA